MNRLVSENCGDSRISYKYDLSGNRISRVTDGRTENYLYNSRNQLTQLTGDDKNISYTYDPAGNLTEEHSTEHKKIYFYDTYNRNTEITGNDFTQKNHYDAEGYRYSIEENDKVTNFVYRRGIMLAELDEAGNQAKTYTLGNEYAGHVSELNNSLTSENKAASYYITDEQGSIRYMLDQSGEVQNYYQYSAFGETIISEETTPNRLRYNAQTEDELTGLYYLRARYYAPGIGRFTQEDVIYNDGLNLYAYCNSNPVMYSDPSGFAKETCKSKVGGECGSETSYGKSSGKLNWDAIVSKKGETRVDHINRHAVSNNSRETHGVFNGNPIDMVNDAWEQRHLVEPISDGMGGTIYNIPYKNAGYESGYINTGAQMNYITIVTLDESTDLITAFPSFGDYHK